MTARNLRAKFPDAPIKVAKIFADHGYRDSKHVVNLFHGMDNAVEALTSLTKLSERELLKSLGLDARPDCSGVTLHAPCHVGGVLAPDRTQLQSSGAKTSLSESLPNHASLIDLYGPPRDQGRLGTCTAQAGVAMVEPQLGRRKIPLSVRFLYWGTKSIDGKPDSEGSFLRFTSQWLEECGTCLEETCPYVEDRDTLRERPSEAAFEEAMEYRPESRSLLVAGDVPLIKAELADGRPVGLSLPIYKSHYANLRFHSEGRFTLPLPFDRIAGGHAVCAVAFLDDDWLTANGFDTELGGGCVLIRNSWGEWARNNELAQHFGASCGYGIVPYRFIEEHCWEAVSVTFRRVSTWQRHMTRFRDDAARKLAAAGSSWWQDTRGRVVAQARERLFGLD